MMSPFYDKLCITLLPFEMNEMEYSFIGCTIVRKNRIGHDLWKDPTKSHERVG